VLHLLFRCGFDIVVGDVFLLFVAGWCDACCFLVVVVWCLICCWGLVWKHGFCGWDFVGVFALGEVCGVSLVVSGLVGWGCLIVAGIVLLFGVVCLFL